MSLRPLARSPRLSFAHGRAFASVGAAGVLLLASGCMWVGTQPGDMDLAPPPPSPTYRRPSPLVADPGFGAVGSASSGYRAGDAFGTGTGSGAGAGDVSASQPDAGFDASSETPPAAEPPPVEPAPPAARTYTVKKGDRLWNIARDQYGDPMKWVEIAEANPEINPDRLRVGDELVLP